MSAEKETLNNLFDILPGDHRQPEEPSEPAPEPEVGTLEPEPQEDEAAEAPGGEEESPELDLFGRPVERWREHWKGMPEFVQEDLTPHRTIYVHFESNEDVSAFSDLIGQTITPLTKTLWYPEAEIGRIANKRYVDTRKDEEGNRVEVEADLGEVGEPGEGAGARPRADRDSR